MTTTLFHTPQSLCRAGLAVRDITPPVGIYHRMWGAARHDRSAGVHRPLRGSALVLGSQTGGERQAVIAVDHCLLLRPEMERLAERLTAAVPLEKDEIAVTFSHTHAAGLMDTGRSHLPGGELIGPYLEDLGEGLADALSEALGALEPAAITYATGRCSLAKHRDFWDESTRQFVCGFNPHAPADDTVLAARISRADGSLLATVVNYACHPTTLAWQNELLSPDYPGATREVVEEATGAPCVFLQGASGDLGPRDGFVGDPEVADRNGRQLGYAVLEALESAPPPRTVLEYDGPVVSGATLGVWRHRRLLEPELIAKREWRRAVATVALPYRRDLPLLEETRARLEEHEGRERAARAAGREQEAAQARALAERMTRQRARLAQLPPGASYPYRASCWRLGDAVWVAVEGEPYNLLQRELRQRFPQAPIVVIALAGGWGPSYLPERDTYGKGIYQESVAVLAPGSLETLIEALTGEIERLVDSQPQASRS